MHPLSPACRNCILELLDQGESAHSIHKITGFSVSTISRIRAEYHPNLSTSSGGHPCKLSPPDIHYAVRLITSRKADNAAQVYKSLQNVVQKPFTTKTLRRELRKV